MRKKWLLELADELEKLASTKRKKMPKFDLEFWGQQRSTKIGKKVPTKLSCATDACAVGTAMLLPSFQKQGLKCSVGPEGDMYPIYKGYGGWGAVEKFFLIDNTDAISLFESGSYPPGYTKGKQGLRAVAARIREFVKAGGAPNNFLRF